MDSRTICNFPPLSRSGLTRKDVLFRQFMHWSTVSIRANLKTATLSQLFVFSEVITATSILHGIAKMSDKNNNDESGKFQSAKPHAV